MFMITIENLMRFHEHFDDKVISTKNFPLGFGKVQSTHLSCGFFAQIFSAILNLVTWPARERLVRSRSPHSKLHKWIAFDCAAVKQQKKTKKTS